MFETVTQFPLSASSALSIKPDIKLRSEDDRQDLRRLLRIGTLNSKPDFDLRNFDGEAIGLIGEIADSGGGANGGDSERLRFRVSGSGF